MLKIIIDFLLELLIYYCRENILSFDWREGGVGRIVFRLKIFLLYRFEFFFKDKWKVIDWVLEKNK